MTTKRIDARGLSCPQPVILVDRAIADGNKDLEILVDNEVARENVTRLINRRGMKADVSQKAQILSFGRPSYKRSPSDGKLSMKTIYLDNAATSFPKPEAMLAAMINYSQTIGASPGRSGHGLSIDAGRVVFETREKLARLFNIEDPLRIAFTKNVTEAINIALFGLLKKGDHVVTTSMEHNSVMRPLRFLQSQGVELSVIPCSSQGELDPNDVHRALQKNTKLVVMTHASNVTGTIMPLKKSGR